MAPLRRARPEGQLPSWIRIEEPPGGGIRITRAWHKQGDGGLLLLTLAVAALVVGAMRLSLGRFDPFFVSVVGIFMGLHVLRAAVNRVNSTVIEADHSQLLIRSGPLPFGPSARLPASEVTRVDVEQTVTWETGISPIRKERTPHFHLTARLRNGARQRLLKKLYSREEAELLAEWIGYGLSRGAVSG